MSCDRLRAAAEEVLTMLAVGGHLSASDPAINQLRAALDESRVDSATDNEIKKIKAERDYYQRAYGRALRAIPADLK